MPVGDADIARNAAIPPTLLLHILAVIPVASITIQFLNRPQIIQLGYQFD